MSKTDFAITSVLHWRELEETISTGSILSPSTQYSSVAVSRSKEVPAFGPPLPKGATFSKCADFHDWLLTKSTFLYLNTTSEPYYYSLFHVTVINAENAVHRSKKFATMAARTRREALRDLAENYVGTHQNEGPSRIASKQNHRLAFTQKIHTDCAGFQVVSSAVA